MTTAFSYDVLEYPSHVHPQAHPSRLAAIGRLHGLDAASPAACRLLEVGCGDGLQLLALAMAYPRSRFVGIDLSREAIARGDAMRQTLGLGNLQLVVADLADWDPGPAAFDYIVAHGFYSWVPGYVRERLLALCREALSPPGIAYVSYNALPGCHLRRLMWDMLRHHTRGIEDPRARIAAACALLECLESDVAGSRIYGEIIRSEARDLLRRTDMSVLFHDDLADTNQPFSITDFAAHAAASGLRYLAEADYHEMSDAGLQPAARERLAARANGDRLQREQYLDYLKGRRFRQTLLCHAEAPLREVGDSAAVRGLRAVGHLRMDAPDGGTLDLANGVAACFTSGDGAALTTDHPVIKAALAMIGNAFPGAPGFDDTLAAARAASRSPNSPEADADALAHAWLSAFELGLLTLHSDPPAFATEAGATPKASALARLQVASGSDLVTSLRPSMVRLDSALAIELIRLLDGSRDRADLRRDLAARMVERAASAPDPGAGAHDAAWWEAQLDGMLEDGLRQTARMALLVG
ncbi:MAG: class I SAM-dependent methyltransferase [Xanthomonadales bacterium]|nr:class I SAM-dependent methyltransferase [Xanthomonadales bacterium]